MGLTVRGRDAGKFWFSLFHELGHIILGHIAKVDGTMEEDDSNEWFNGCNHNVIGKSNKEEGF